MGNLLGSEKPLKEVVRENQRLIRKGIRDLEKEIRSLETNMKRLESDIRKLAKQNQMGAVKVLAKDYVRSKAHVTRFIEMKTHLNAVSLKMQTVASHQAMADAMRGVTTALVRMNQQMKLPALQKMTAEFMRENERAELTQEMMGDAIDDAMATEGSAEQEEMLVGQILDELGVTVAGQLASVPTGAVGAQNADATAETSAVESELEARLNRLRG